jgi:hypothetical protein
MLPRRSQCPSLHSFLTARYSEMTICTLRYSQIVATPSRLLPLPCHVQRPDAADWFSVASHTCCLLTYWQLFSYGARPWYPVPLLKYAPYVSTYARTYLHTRAHIYTYLHTYIHVHTYVRTYTHIYTHTHTYVHTRTHIHIRTHARTHTYTYIHARTYTHIHIHTYVHTHTHTHTYVRTYTYVHTHTHSHTHTHTRARAHTHIRKYTHTYTHTQTHTYVRTYRHYTHTYIHRYTLIHTQRDPKAWKNRARWTLKWPPPLATPAVLYFWNCREVYKRFLRVFPPPPPHVSTASTAQICILPTERIYGLVWYSEQEIFP